MPAVRMAREDAPEFSRACETLRALRRARRAHLVDHSPASLAVLDAAQAAHVAAMDPLRWPERQRVYVRVDAEPDR